MSLIEQQKQSAKAVLDKLRCLDNRAIIAGGAPRDWYFSKLANDIDIFYYHEQGKWCLDNIGKQIKILQILLGVEDVTVLGFNPDRDNIEPTEDYNNYIKNPDIVNVFECMIDGLKFQFIQLRKQNLNVSKFAYNMCQAWSDGVNIWTTDLFDVGVKKELLIETGELYSNTNKFKQKMIDKFPNYTYIKTNVK